MNGEPTECISQTAFNPTAQPGPERNNRPLYPPVNAPCADHPRLPELPQQATQEKIKGQG